MIRSAAASCSVSSTAGRWWDAKIGLEIHAQVSAASKLFSAAPGTLQQSKQPNACVSFFDSALPGTLPRLNRVAVQQAIRAASAFKCEINKTSYFERKHYFYQDLPLGYQITQQRMPIAQNGMLEFDVIDSQGKFQYKTKVGIERIQMEQDSGKSLHNLNNEITLVDLNRAGVGLLEIVFSPDLKTPHEASSCLRAIQKLLRHIGVCDGNMQDGSMRCDVNVSVHERRSAVPKGIAAESSQNEVMNGRVLMGSRVEVKNINSIYSVYAAASYEIQRHISMLESNEFFSQETRGYDDVSETTFNMRAKETAVDYRIFPDPDIPILRITDADIQDALQTAEGLGRVELPDVTIANIIQTYKLDKSQAESLLANSGAHTYFERIREIADNNVESVDIYNWMMGDVLGNLNSNYFSFANSPLEPSQLNSVISLVKGNHISALQAKKVIKCLFEAEYIGIDPHELVEQKRWKQITDTSIITKLIEEAIADPNNSKKLHTFQKNVNKRDRMISFFFGEVMKRSKGQASPQSVKELLSDALLQTLK